MLYLQELESVHSTSVPSHQQTISIKENNLKICFFFVSSSSPILRRRAAANAPNVAYFLMYGSWCLGTCLISYSTVLFSLPIKKLLIPYYHYLLLTRAMQIRLSFTCNLWQLTFKPGHAWLDTN